MNFSWDSSAWSVQKHSVVIENIGNDGNVVNFASIVNQDNSSWFNKSSETLKVDKLAPFDKDIKNRTISLCVFY